MIMHFKYEVGGLNSLDVTLYNSINLRSWSKVDLWYSLRGKQQLKLKPNGVSCKIKNIGMVVFPGQQGKAETTFFIIIKLVYYTELKLIKIGICLEFVWW